MAMHGSDKTPPPPSSLPSDDELLRRLHKALATVMGRSAFYYELADEIGVVPEGVTCLPQAYCQLHALEIEGALEILHNLGGPKTSIRDEVHLNQGPVTTDACGWHALDGEKCAGTAYIWYEAEGPET